MSFTNPSVVDLSIQLTTLAVKGTATAVTNKIKAAKEIRDNEKLRNVYDEIVNELLNERDEAVRIAQAYKSELDRIVISDEDIRHLESTVSNVLEILKDFSPDIPVDAVEQFKGLISVDTLKTMQLLGFNYKAAIGEPLTTICAEKIRSWSSKKSTSSGSKQQSRNR
jgi:hypothetical protein